MSRTVSFIVKIQNGTSPYILIDYNDTTPVAKPVFCLLNTVYSFNHTFSNSGYFDVNITVFNLVSTVSKIVRVSQNITKIS
jgi:hypothetical protein